MGTESVQYSIQPSVLKPDNINGEYIRLQLRLRPELETTVITNNDYDTIVSSLNSGRLVKIESEDGRSIGQFQPSLAGGTEQSEFITPSQSNARVGFKAAQSFLEEVRVDMTFEQLPTVVVEPTITNIQFLYDDVVLDNKIKLNQSGILRVIGTNYIKDGMKLTVSQEKSDTSIVVSSVVSTSVSKTKIVDFIISSDTFSSLTFENNTEGTQPINTIVSIAYIDNELKLGNLDFEFLPPDISVNQVFFERFVNSFAIHNSTLFAGSTAGDLFASTTGLDWSLVSTVLPNATIDSMISFEGNLYAGLSSSAGIFFSVDDGVTFTSSLTVEVGDRITGLAEYNGDLFAITSGGAAAKVYKLNAGETALWTLVYTSGDKYFNSIKVFNGSMYIASYDGGKIYKTEDGTNYSIAYSTAHLVLELFELNGKLQSVISVPESTELNYIIGTSDGTVFSQLATLTVKGFVRAVPQTSNKTYIISGDVDASVQDDIWYAAGNIGDLRAWSSIVFNDKIYLGCNPLDHVTGETSGIYIMS